jgi:hypothetical protein
MIAIWCVVGTGLTDRIVRLVEREQRDVIAALAGKEIATHIATERNGRIIEAIVPRVRETDASVYDHYTVYRFPLALTATQEEAVWQGLQTHLGEWYDLIGLVKCGLYCRTGHVQRWLEDDDAVVQCAALPVDVLREHGHPILAGIPPSNCTPPAVEGWMVRPMTVCC